MRIAGDLKTNFPGLRVLEIDLPKLNIVSTDPRLQDLKKRKQAEIRNRINSLEEVKNLRVFRAYRDFYWKVGIDPTKTRPAGEALTRRILSGKDIPTINTLVDSYNIASAESSIAIAAFDFSTISKDHLLMRMALKGETFLGIGMEKEVNLRGVEVVIEDESNAHLVAIYPYRDSESTKVTVKTRQAAMMMCGVPGITDEDLEVAGALTKRYIEEFCQTTSEQV